MKIPSIGNITVYNQLKELNDLNTKERLGFGNHGIKLNANVLTGAKGNKASGGIDDKIIQLRVETIMAKLKYGKKISPEEMKFLQKHAPHVYNKAITVLRERETFRQELKTYKTKQQADRAYAMKISGYMPALKASAGKASGNEEAGGELEVIQMKSAAIMDEYNRFKMSAEYRKLEDEEQEDKKIPAANRTIYSVSRRSLQTKV